MSGQDQASLKVALACDWLTTPGGAEKVLLELHRMYPEAPIYTSQYSRRGINWFNNADVRTGWLQIFPAGLRKILGPLRQIYFSHLDLSDYDLVISVTGAEAKSVRASKHICYCHVPTQYYWQMYDKYVENPGFGFLNPVVRFFFKTLVKPLRKADYAAAQRPDEIITISDYAKKQIQKYYNREAKVIAPPVDVKKFQPNYDKNKEIHKKSTGFPQDDGNLSTISEDFSTLFPHFFHRKDESFPQGYYVIACRQVTWKRVDLAIRACIKAQKPLLVIGDGPEHYKLLDLAEESPYITFLPWLKADELAKYLRKAKGYIFPSLEPFGIAAVEALAAGCPVVAFAEGGSRDFIKNNANGLLFAKQDVESLIKAIKKFDQMKFNRKKVSASVQKFDAVEFRQHMDKNIKEYL